MGCLRYAGGRWRSRRTSYEELAQITLGRCNQQDPTEWQGPLQALTFTIWLVKFLMQFVSLCIDFCQGIPPLPLRH